jgi:hypothetical protein
MERLGALWVWQATLVVLETTSLPRTLAILRPDTASKRHGVYASFSLPRFSGSLTRPRNRAVTEHRSFPLLSDKHETPLLLDRLRSQGTPKPPKRCFRYGVHKSKTDGLISAGKAAGGSRRG